MPYIKMDEREQYKELIQNISAKLSKLDDNDVSGHLNYIIYTLMNRIIQDRGIRYFRLNNLIGTLGCCEKEFYRRIISPYEDKAIEKNGDIL